MKRTLLGVVLLLAGAIPVDAQAPNDYSDPATWLCRPGRPDACAIDHTTSIVAADGTVTLESWAADPNAPIDCFYVYPTISTDPGTNSDMEPDPAEFNVIAQQFARFASECRPFAPIYRQVTLAGLRSRMTGGGAANTLNYDDVRDAWMHYLEHDNQGRGFVLIGHSQGSSVLRELIRLEIDGKPVQDRMVSALLIGMTIPVRADGELGGVFQNVPVCRSGSQIGCLISYVSFRSTIPPPENTRFGAVDPPELVAACVNPAELARGSNELHGYLSTSGRTITGTTPPKPWIAGGPAIETPWVSVPGLLTGRCTSNENATYLEVSVNADPADPRTDEIVGDIGSGDRIARDWGLHLVDMNIAMGDLVEVVRMQSDVWVAERAAAAQAGAPAGEWPTYGGDLGSSKYSPLAEIQEGNVERLSVVWHWRSPDDEVAANADPELEMGSFKATPLMIDGVLYIRTSLSMVAAIDAATGKQLWVFDPGSYEMGRPTNLGFNSRGVAYWREGDDARIFLATGDSHLWAIHPMTGEPIESFGHGGKIDLTQGLRRPVPRESYQVMSPPLVIRDVVVVGSSISDGPRNTTAPPGDVRAFDARTGELRWNFKTIPQAGEFGNDTWENGGWEYTGNTNVWTMMSADEELGLVYLPIGTPTNDWYGGHRLGDDLFAESLVAVDAETGERRWHYQLVHHGVWDYDIPAAPTLVDITVEGRPIRAVAQVTKQGFVYVFDRATGEPVWPVVERPVARSTIPGERLSPTQPFPSRPAPFERQGLSKDDLIDFTPELRAEAEQLLSESDHGGLFHPPSLKGTINLPGWGGGANWQGAAADPETGILYVPSRTSPMRVQLEPGDPERTDFQYVRASGGSATGPQGFPLVKPPYARLTAIDLDTGDHVWQVPLGDGVRQRVIDLGVPDPGPLGGGGFTGPLVTPTFLFLGHSGSRDGNPEPAPALLAIDKMTGETVRPIPLPANPTGTPMTYSVHGRQFIAVAVTGPDGTGLVGLAVE